MSNRKALSKRTRFEVFKRDSFTCQYCGRKAPEVILNCDHIKPVADGGSNAILNLITSCESCNSGKSGKPLSDSSAVSLAHNQAAILQERRLQIQMLSDWYAGLNAIEDEQLDILNRQISILSGFTLNEIGGRNAKSLIKKHGLSKVVEHFQSAFLECVFRDEDSFSACFEKASKSLKWSIVPREIQKSKYLTGVIRNRFKNYWAWYPAFERLFKMALIEDITQYDDLFRICTSSDDIESARDRAIDYLAEFSTFTLTELEEEWNK